MTVFTQEKVIEIFTKSQNSHVAQTGNMWHKPGVNDIVRIFGKDTFGIITNVYFNEGRNEGRGERVFEVARFDSSCVSAMPFESETELIAQSKANWVEAMENRSIAEQQAKEAFTASLFDEIDF